MQATHTSLIPSSHFYEFHALAFQFS